MSRPGFTRFSGKSGDLPGSNSGQWYGHGLETRRPRRCWRSLRGPRRRQHRVALEDSPRLYVHALFHRPTAPFWGAVPVFSTVPRMQVSFPQFFCLILFQPSKSDRLCRCHFRTNLSAHTCLPGYLCKCYCLFGFFFSHSLNVCAGARPTLQIISCGVALNAQTIDGSTPVCCALPLVHHRLDCASVPFVFWASSFCLCCA